MRLQLNQRLIRRNNEIRFKMIIVLWIQAKILWWINIIAVTVSL